jgi:hypothetical protein
MEASISKSLQIRKLKVLVRLFMLVFTVVASLYLTVHFIQNHEHYLVTHLEFLRHEGEVSTPLTNPEVRTMLVCVLCLVDPIRRISNHSVDGLGNSAVTKIGRFEDRECDREGRSIVL